MLTYLRRIEDGKKSRGFSSWRGLFGPRTRYEQSDEFPNDFTERRLNRRLFDYWQRKCRAGGLPCPSTIDAAELGGDWDYCFLLDARDLPDFANFIHLGQKLAPFSGVYLSGKEDWFRTVLDKTTQQVPRALQSRKPVLCDDELTLFDGRRLLFRTVLLPLSEDGTAVTHLLGAANGRYAEADEKAEVCA